MKKSTRKIQRLFVTLLVVAAILAATQYGIGSVAKAEKGQKYTENESMEQAGFNGEWIEIANRAVVIRTADTEDARPDSLPYFYLSKNWESCVEYTQATPHGRTCSPMFYDLLEQADTFLVEG